MFFFLALGLSTIGPGSIGASALLAPPAMAVAARTGISFFLMAVMIGGPDVRNAALMTVFLAWRHKQNFRNLFAARNES